MSRIDDIKELLKSQLSTAWNQIQESSVYQQLNDRYENLSPRAQKIAAVGAIFIILLIVLSMPLQFLQNSYDQINQYETQRGLIHDLFKIQQDSQASAGISPGPSQSTLQSQIEKELKNSQLAPEQIKSVQGISTLLGLPKEYIDSNLEISLAKINLRQVVDIGYQILNIHPTLKMIDLNIGANTEDSRYFDVIYKIASLKVPVFAPPAPVEDEKPKKNQKGTSKPSKKDINDGGEE